MPDVATRSLPPGVKVAAPFYAISSSSNPEADFRWVTQPELRFTNPAATPHEISQGRLIGVVYGPDGTVVTGLASSSGIYGQSYVDFDGDELQQIGATTEFPEFFIYDEPEDEVNLTHAPFLAVYDDDEVREIKSLDWSIEPNYIGELTGSDGYITKHADRIHFNRYTGVVMK